MLLTTIRQLWQPDIAIDLGTATFRVAVAHRRLPFSAPSTPASSCGGIVVPQALARGVVVDVEAAAEALRPILHYLRRRGLNQPRALACAPSDTTAQERAAVIETCRRAGVKDVVLMPEPVAAALGDGADYASTRPILLLDIGEGVTDCALIRQGRLVDAAACRVGCANLRAAVQKAVDRWCGIRLSDTEAIRLINRVGMGHSAEDASGMPPLRLVPIPDLSRTGDLPLPVGIVQEALRPVMGHMVMTVLSLLSTWPGLRRELAQEGGGADTGSGMRVSGGGALIPGVAEHMAAAIGLPVRAVRSPLGAVVQGARRVLPLVAGGDLWKELGDRP
jgi:rod shape-determining protein MreB